MDKPLTDVYKGLLAFVVGVAITILVLSGLIITGWLIESLAVSRLGSGLHTMNLNVAISFFFASLAMLSLVGGYYYLTLGMISLLIFIPLLTLHSYWMLGNWNIGDWLPITQNFLEKFDIPMDLTTGLGLMLSGVALLILVLRLKHLMTVAIIIGSLISAIGLVGFILMSNNIVDSPYRWLSYISSNVLSSIFLIALGIAISALTILIMRKLEITLKPLHVLIPLGVLFYLTAFGLYSALLIQKNANTSHTMKLAVSWVEKDLRRELDDTNKKLQNLITAFDTLSIKPENAKQYASLSLNHQTGFEAIALLNSSKELVWEAWTGRNQYSKIFQDIQIDPKGTIQRVFLPDLNQYGFLMAYPLSSGDSLVAYKTDLQLFHDALTDLRLSGYDTDLIEVSGEMIHHAVLPPGIEEVVKRHQYSSIINLEGASWELRIRPTPPALSQMTSYLPEIALGLGLILSTLTLATVLLYFTTKASQIKAQKIEKRLETLIQTLLDGIITTNEKSEIVGWNGGAEQIFGYTREEVLGQSIFMLVPQKNREVYESGANAILEDEATISGKVIEIMGVRKNGEEFPIEASISTWKSNGDTYSTGIIRDITDRKLLEDSLRKTTAQAEKASQIKSEFLAKISHEMRTPLTSILGYSELLLSPETNASEYPFFINIIQSNGKHLLELITDILDLTGIESNNLKIDHIKCSPKEILEEVVASLKPYASKKGLSIEIESTKGTPLHIFTDPRRVSQILYKLIHNAIKFTEKGSVKVTISNPNKNKVPTSLQFIVVDTGIGISNEIGKDLFKVFSESDSSFVRKIGGSGIGLAVSQRLAELLGGGISYYSEEGRGSTFVLTIATGLTSDLMEPSPVEEEHKLQPSETPMENKILNNKRILIAEDNQDTQRLIALSLKYAGANVETVGDGRQAFQKGLDALEAGDLYDVILMDIEMPEMSGIEATQKLRAAGYRAPIIALTAFATKEESDKCLAAGCNEVIVKPVDREYLINKMNLLTCAN